MKTSQDNQRDGDRVTVRLSAAQTRRLDAVCAATKTRAELTRAAVLRALIDDLEAPGFSASGSTSNVIGGPSSCDRVHLDDVTAHKLLVELGREGRSVNMIAAKINSLANGLVRPGEFVELEDVEARLDALDERIVALRDALGASGA